MRHIFEGGREDDTDACSLCGARLESEEHVRVERPLPGSVPVFVRRAELLHEVSAVLRLHGYERMALLVDALRDPEQLRDALIPALPRT